MSFFQDYIVYIWLLPVIVQIVLPLGVFALWPVIKILRSRSGEKVLVQNPSPA